MSDPLTNLPTAFALRPAGGAGQVPGELDPDGEVG